MREIKFRAWENGKMRYDFWQRCDLGNYLNSIGVFKDIKTMQFTGLQDKNGKDIYEGDIVRTWSGVEHMGAWEFSDLFEVKWDFKLLMELSMWDYVEVIGNIYENPELLTN